MPELPEHWLAPRAARAYGQGVLNERIRVLVYELAVAEGRACRWPRNS